MKVFELLNEMPMADITFHGDSTRNKNFSASDMKLMKKFALEKTYHKKLQKVPFELYVYVISAAGLKAIGEMFPEGEIKMLGGAVDFEHNTGGQAGLYKRMLMAMESDTFAEVFQAIEKNKEKDPSAVHFVMGDNYAGDGDGQIAPTAWILIHRLSHTVQRSVMSNIRHMYHDLRASVLNKNVASTASSIKFIGQTLGIRSLANGSATDPGEIISEIVTKYLITGKLEASENKIQSVFDKFCTDVMAAVDAEVKEMKGRVFYI